MWNFIFQIFNKIKNNKEEESNLRMNKCAISFLLLALLALAEGGFLTKKPHSVPTNFKKIAYVNSISSWYGPAILDSFGINSPCYDIIILTFWMPGYVSDALGVWSNIHYYLGTDEFGSTTPEV